MAEERVRHGTGGRRGGEEGAGEGREREGREGRRGEKERRRLYGRKPIPAAAQAVMCERDAATEKMRPVRAGIRHIAHQSLQARLKFVN